MNSAKDTCVFLVRMWLLGGGAETRGIWRGSIQDVGAARILYLANTHEIADFIDARLSARTGTDPFGSDSSREASP